MTRKARVWLGIAAAVVVAVLAVVLFAVAADDEDEIAGDATTTGTAAPGATSATTEPDGDTPATTGSPATTAPPATTATTVCDPAVEGDLLGTHDLDGDGVAELFVGVGAGASTQVVGVFRVEGCEAVAVAGGSEFAVGAAATHIDGLRAAGSTLEAYAGTSQDGQSFDVTRRSYRLTGGELVATGTERMTAQLGDELYRTASTLTGLAPPA